jgi:hypothetical protein
MRLNLGCGHNPTRREGEDWLNVDSVPGPGVDAVEDLERVPWCLAGAALEGFPGGRHFQEPLPSSSVGEVVLSHVMEHLGREPRAFIGFIKELYRVCSDGAVIRIAVPHPRHDDFLGDPTHVRPILPATLEMFSRAACQRWQEGGYANTPLALIHNVDFEIVNLEYVLDERFSMLAGQPETQHVMLTQSNVCREIRIEWRVVKPAKAEAGAA